VVPSGTQINYHVNLGLLYGAKELRCDPFFSSFRCNDSRKPSTTGLINNNEDTTTNYNLFRYTIIPRLNGSYGKTLKRIHQTTQAPGQLLPIQAVYNQYLKYVLNDGDSPSDDYVDIGFFERSDEDYFMILPR